MIVAVVTAIVVLGCVIVSQSVLHRWDRQEWARERRALIDRAIARHSGEVIGLDRQAARPDHEPVPHRAPIEGLE